MTTNKMLLLAIVLLIMFATLLADYGNCVGWWHDEDAVCTFFN